MKTRAPTSAETPMILHLNLVERTSTNVIDDRRKLITVPAYGTLESEEFMATLYDLYKEYRAR